MNTRWFKNFVGVTTFPPDIWAICLLVGSVLWFNDEIVRNGKVPFFGDLAPYFYPMRFNLAQSFQAGELPLWNKHVSMGFPYLANLQAGVFYPLHLVYAFLPIFDAVRVIFVSHYLVATLGCYFLCREWKYPIYLSIVGSMLFGFGGMMISVGHLMDHFQTAAWLPWVLLSGERYFALRLLKNFLFFTAILLLQFLAGSPEFYFMTLGLLIIDGMRIKSETKLSYGKLGAHLLASNALVAGLAMVQILPTVELFMQSWRADGIPYLNLAAHSLEPLRLINVFFLDKEVNLDSIGGLSLFFNQQVPLIISLYMGALVLPGLSLWFATSGARERAILLCLVTVSVVFAMGNHTPVFSLLYQYVPFLGILRFPEKFYFVTSAFLLFMMLRGVHRFVELHWSRQSFLIAALSVPPIALLLPYLWFRFDSEPLIRFIAHAKQSATVNLSTIAASSGVLVQLERLIVLVIGLSSLLLLWKMGKLGWRVFAALLIAVTLFDLSSAHRPYLFPLNPAFTSETPEVIHQPDSEPFRLFYNHNLSYLHPNYFTLSPRSFAQATAAVYKNLIPNTGLFYGFEYMQELDALGRKPYDRFLKIGNELPPDGLYRLLGRMNIKYVNSLHALPLGDISLVRHFPEYPSWLYKIDSVIPRIYVVPKAIVRNDYREILEQLSSEGFKPREEVILSEPLSLNAKEEFRGQAKFLRYTHQLVDIEASLESPGILVLADSFYPGWRVFINGQEGKILRANSFFRGVRLPAGEHRVEFRYEPRWFMWGLIISIGTLTLTVVFFVLRWLGGKRWTWKPS